MGTNKPHRKPWKAKKLEKVWASKTSLTVTAIKRPKNVEVTARKKTLAKTINQFIPAKFIRNEANTTGMKAFRRPKRIAPEVLASIKIFKSMGARSKRSKERLLLSKVMVTANIEVVPNKMDMAMTPGKMLRISTGDWERTKNIRVQARGNIIPQLMLGGFR